MTISNYMIAHPPGRTELSVVVENLINQGWQPYGYPYLDRNGTEKQAMVVRCDSGGDPLKNNASVDDQSVPGTLEDAKNDLGDLLVAVLGQNREEDGGE